MDFVGEVGIEGWNEFEEYAFVYAKGSKKFLVKCFAIEDKLLVDAVDDGGKEPAHIEIEYVVIVPSLFVCVLDGDWSLDFTLFFFLVQS